MIAPGDDNAGDLGVAAPDDQDAAIDRELDAVVQFQFVGNYALSERKIYDGLIRAARRIRRGRSLDSLAQ